MEKTAMQELTERVIKSKLFPPEMEIYFLNFVQSTEGIERQQIINAWNAGVNNHFDDPEEYYKNKYGK